METNIDENKLIKMLSRIVELEKSNAKTNKFNDEKMKDKIKDIIMSEADKNDN